MPDARLARTRATLPSGYQFGDAAGNRTPKKPLRGLERNICDIPFMRVGDIVTVADDPALPDDIRGKSFKIPYVFSGQ